MQIKPLGDGILVEQLTSEEVTKSGIVLPETAEKEKKAQGKVVETGVGPVASMFKIGDIVVFGKYAGEEVEVEENGKKKEYKILYVGDQESKSDVLAKIYN